MGRGWDATSGRDLHVTEAVTAACVRRRFPWLLTISCRTRNRRDSKSTDRDLDVTRICDHPTGNATWKRT